VRHVLDKISGWRTGTGTTGQRMTNNSFVRYGPEIERTNTTFDSALERTTASLRDRITCF